MVSMNLESLMKRCLSSLQVMLMVNPKSPKCHSQSTSSNPTIRELRLQALKSSFIISKNNTNRISFRPTVSSSQEDKLKAMTSFNFCWIVELLAWNIQRKKVSIMVEDREVMEEGSLRALTLVLRTTIASRTIDPIE